MPLPILVPYDVVFCACRCGLRGGYIELVGLNDQVRFRIKTYLSTRSCPSTIGQVRKYINLSFNTRVKNKLGEKRKVENQRKRDIPKGDVFYFSLLTSTKTWKWKSLHVYVSLLSRQSKGWVETLRMLLWRVPNIAFVPLTLWTFILSFFFFQSHLRHFVFLLSLSLSDSFLLNLIFLSSFLRQSWDSFATLPDQERNLTNVFWRSGLGFSNLSLKNVNQHAGYWPFDHSFIHSLWFAIYEGGHSLKWKYFVPNTSLKISGFSIFFFLFLDVMQGQ